MKAPSHKKQKGDSVQIPARRSQAVDIEKHPAATVVFENKDWRFTSLHYIKPEAGTIDTGTEEEDL